MDIRVGDDAQFPFVRVAPGNVEFGNDTWRMAGTWRTRGFHDDERIVGVIIKFYVHIQIS
jgi:hypothetical protein